MSVKTTIRSFYENYIYLSFHFYQLQSMVVAFLVAWLVELLNGYQIRAIMMPYVKRTTAKYKSKEAFSF